MKIESIQVLENTKKKIVVEWTTTDGATRVTQGKDLPNFLTQFAGCINWELLG